MKGVLKELAFSTGVTIVVLGLLAFGLILNSVWAESKDRESKAAIKKVVDERLAPLEKRIEELEKRSK